MIKLFEKYNNIAEIKEMIFLKSIDTGEIYVIDFFVKKGYKADDDDIFERVIYNIETLKYFLKKGLKPFYPNYDYRIKEKLKTVEIQRILIDFNYAQFINDEIGFNRELITKDEVERIGIEGIKDFINMKYDMNKFNL